MIGLVPHPDQLIIAIISRALGNLETVIKSSLNTTYFITQDMKIDLHEQNLNGVFPILYAFIARADKSITNVTFGSLSSGGAFQKAAPGKKAISVSGARIRYNDNLSGVSQPMNSISAYIS